MIVTCAEILATIGGTQDFRSLTSANENLVCSSCGSKVRSAIVLSHMNVLCHSCQTAFDSAGIPVTSNIETNLARTNERVRDKYDLPWLLSSE